MTSFSFPTPYPFKSGLIFLSLFLSGCALAPADTSDPLSEAEQLPQQASLLVMESQSEAATDVEFLDQLIQSDQLVQLLKEGFLSNPNLQKTWLTLQIRRSEKKRIDGQQLPSVNAGLISSKVEDTDLRFTGSVDVSWELNLWNKLSDKSNLATKNINQQAYLLQAARDTLAAEIIDSWLELIAQKKSLDIQNSLLNVLEKNETFITQRYRSGLGDSEDLSSARSSTSSARAVLEENIESHIQQQRSLQNLLGRTDRRLIDITDQYPSVILALADLPEQDLRRRPDLQAAYLAIEAADLNSAVAYKELLPNVSIKAALEDVADSPNAALLLDPVWSLLAQLTAPLYQGGQLRAAVEIADLETAVAYQTYRDTLLTAVTEVENALSLEHSLAIRQQHIEKALENSHDSLAKFQTRYRSGLVTILDLLNVEKSTYDLEDQLNNLIYQRLTNRITLGLALGLGVSQ